MSSYQPIYSPAPVPPAQRPAVRWTFIDLALVAALTIAFALVAVVLLRLSTSLGVADIRGIFGRRPVVAVVSSVAIVDLLAVVATAIIIVARRRGSWREIGFRAPPLLPLLLTPVIFLAEMIAIAVINLTILQVTGAFDNPQRDLFTDPSGFSWLNFGLALVAGAIIAPIVEELVFRGLLYQWLRARTNVVTAVILSGAIFGAIHGIPIAFPALFLVGMVLAATFEYSRSLWVPIALHFLQNATVISLLFFAQANPQLFPQS